MTTQSPFSLELPAPTSAPTKNSRILTVGADAKNKAESSTPQLTDATVDNLIQDDALFFRQHSSPSTPHLTDATVDDLKQGPANVLSPHSSAVKMSGFIVTPDYMSLFGSSGLHQQAKKIENASVGFCRTTFNNLLALGNTGIVFGKQCSEELGEDQGKSAFNSWLDSDGFGASKYVLRVAMKIAARYSNLKPRLQKLARDNVQFWGLRALDDLFGVSDGLFELMIKRGKRSHKTIKKVDDTLEGKQPNLPRGGYVEVVVDDDRQLKGSIGKIVDKDEHGKMTVKFPHRPEVVLEPKDLSKQTPKAVADYAFKEIESVQEKYDFLHEECLQKDQLIREYELAAAENQISESLIQSQIAQARAEYERSKSESNAALYEETKAAALADARAKIEASEQTIQKLLQQLESKNKLEQIVDDLQRQLVIKHQLESENEELRQEVVELRSTLLHPATNLPSNQNLTTVIHALSLENNPELRKACTEASTNSKLDGELMRIDGRKLTGVATLTTLQETEHFLSQSSDLEVRDNLVELGQHLFTPLVEKRDINADEGCPSFTGLRATAVELDKYQAESIDTPANSFESLSQLEIIELEKELKISQRKNLELEETNEILVEVVKMMKLERAQGEKLPKHKQNLEKNLGKNNSRPSQITTSKPLGFAVRKNSGSR